MKILVAEPHYFRGVMHRLENLGEVITDINGTVDADVIVMRSMTRIDREFLDRAGKLRVVATATTGLDHIDTEECRKRGIRVIDAAGVSGDAVAEYTLGMIISLARKIHSAHASASSGRWNREDYAGVVLSGKTLGIIGYGRIGKKVARAAESMGMRIIAHDPYLADSAIRDSGAEPVPLDELLEKSDVVTIHCNLDSRTKGMLDAEGLSKMKNSAFIVNTSRGAIIDENALIKALMEKRIAGAALDVFEQEPLQNSELIKYAQGNDNLILTPHIAGHAAEALQEEAETVCRRLEEELSR